MADADPGMSPVYGRRVVRPSEDEAPLLQRSPAFALVGAGVLVLGLARWSSVSDGGMAVWSVASLAGLIGAAAAGTSRSRGRKSVRLIHYWLGAYALTGVLVLAAYFVVDQGIVAAMVGSGIVCDLFAGLAVAGFRGRTGGSARAKVDPMGTDGAGGASDRAAPSTIRLRTEKERGRWLTDRHRGDFIDVLYAPDASFAGTLDYDANASPRGPFRAEVVTHEGRVIAVQISVPGVIGGYMTDLRSADGESGLCHPDRSGLTDGLSTNAPGYFVVSEVQLSDAASF
jgi:hypothetical protein